MNQLGLIQLLQQLQQSQQANPLPQGPAIMPGYSSPQDLQLMNRQGQQPMSFRPAGDAGPAPPASDGNIAMMMRGMR